MVHFPTFEDHHPVGKRRYKKITPGAVQFEFAPVALFPMLIEVHDQADEAVIAALKLVEMFLVARTRRIPGQVKEDTRPGEIRSPRGLKSSSG